MRQLIDPILSKIYLELKSNPSTTISLMGGKTGSALFGFLYSKYKNSSEEADILQAEVQIIAENSLMQDSPTFCSGRAGTNWFFAYLHRNDSLCEEDCQLICQEDILLAKLALRMLQEGNYDFLHGAIGIAYYISYGKGSEFIAFYEYLFKLLDSLEKKSTLGQAIPNYDFINKTIRPAEINLGLAHGLPSILKFCIQCYQQQICSKQAENLAMRIVSYLLTHKNVNTDYSFYPSHISDGDEINSHSRLAWCYGDLGIGYMLYQAGITFNKAEIARDALEMLKNTTQRRTSDKTYVFDAAICHGSAGIAHMYNRLWKMTNEHLFKDSCDYWIKYTISFFNNNETELSYKKYNPILKAYENDYGLLEGTAGIGLVLLNYLTNDFTWDYCIMLNS